MCVISAFIPLYYIYIGFKTPRGICQFPLFFLLVFCALHNVQFNSGISNDQLGRPSNRENIRKEFSFIKLCFQLIRQSLRRPGLLNKGSPPTKKSGKCFQLSHATESVTTREERKEKRGARRGNKR